MMMNNQFISDILDYEDDEQEEEKTEEDIEHSKLFLKAHEAILGAFEKISSVDLKKFTDGYYLFTMGDNAVCSFKLDKYPEWLFGTWLKYNKNEDPNKDTISVSIFAQMEQFIDKFKPAASIFLNEFEFCKNPDTQEFEFEVTEYHLTSFNLIWTKPYLAMYRELKYANFNKEYVSPLKAYFEVKKIIREDNLMTSKKIKAGKFLRRKLTKWFQKNLKIFGTFDFVIEDDGENVSPRFHPVVTIPNNKNEDSLITEFESQYINYKNKIREKFGRIYAHVFDKFGWIIWYEWTEGEKHVRV